jgi:hypothetical protein
MMNRLLLALAIWSVFGIVCLISEYAHAGETVGRRLDVQTAEKTKSEFRLRSNINDLESTSSGRRLSPGLAKVMAEGAGRVVNPTCDDVRAVVAWIGEARAVEMAREAGASDSQIREAKRCLKSSSR